MLSILQIHLHIFVLSGNSAEVQLKIYLSILIVSYLTILTNGDI